MQQKILVVCGNLAELHAHAERRLGINDGGEGIEGAVAMNDFDFYGGAAGQGIDHIQVATMLAEVASTRRQAHFGVHLNNDRRSDKRDARRTAEFWIHEALAGQVPKEGGFYNYAWC